MTPNDLRHGEQIQLSMEGEQPFIPPCVMQVEIFAQLEHIVMTPAFPQVSQC